VFQSLPFEAGNCERRSVAVAQVARVVAKRKLCEVAMKMLLRDVMKVSFTPRFRSPMKLSTVSSRHRRARTTHDGRLSEATAATEFDASSFSRGRAISFAKRCFPFLNINSSRRSSSAKYETQRRVEHRLRGGNSSTVPSRTSPLIPSGNVRPISMGL